MADAQKKVIIRLFEANPVGSPLLSGYLPTSGFTDAAQITFMDIGGKSISIPFNAVKLIAYVWDFNSGDTVDPEHLGRRVFLGRPRAEGLWLRMTFRDGDILEGLASSDISLLDPLVTDHGLMVTTPDPRSNTQRLFVPRPALSNLEVLGVIAKRKPAKPREPQPWLFGDS